MLSREDKKKVPIGLIPNGNESDICKSLGIMDIDIALGNIVRAQAVPMDTTRVLIDCDEPDYLPNDVEERYFKCRHMLSDSTLVMPANVSASSKSWWSCCCSSSTAFSVATWFKGLSCSFEPSAFTIEVDDV